MWKVLFVCILIRGGYAKNFPVRSDGYAHSWIKTPKISGYSLAGRVWKVFPVQPGESLVIVFIASWCVSCQELIVPLKEMMKKSRENYTRFLFLFAHDTQKDAAGFQKYFNLKHSIMASQKILKFFHNPPLPSIFVQDRWGWLTKSYLSIKTGEVKELSEFLMVTSGL